MRWLVLLCLVAPIVGCGESSKPAPCNQVCHEKGAMARRLTRLTDLVENNPSAVFVIGRAAKAELAHGDYHSAWAANARAAVMDLADAAARSKHCYYWYDSVYQTYRERHCEDMYAADQLITNAADDLDKSAS